MTAAFRERAAAPPSLRSRADDRCASCRDIIDHARRGDPLALLPRALGRPSFVHVMTSSPQYWAPGTRLASLISPFNVTARTWLSEQEIAALACGSASADCPSRRVAAAGPLSRRRSGPLDNSLVGRAPFGFSPSIPLAGGIAASGHPVTSARGSQAVAGKLLCLAVRRSLAALTSLYPLKRSRTRPSKSEKLP